MERKQDAKDVPSIRTLDELIGLLREIFESDDVNVDYVKMLLAAYKSNPSDWKQYAKFDPHRYTRNLIDTGNGRYNLMALCWGENHSSSIHDHSNSHCFVKVLDGQLKETMYAWPADKPSPSSSSSAAVAESAAVSGAHFDDGHRDGTETWLSEDEVDGLMVTRVNLYPKDGVTYINDSIGLHRVENASHVDPAVSLHVYCPPFDACRTFDERTGVSRTALMTFYSQYGVRTPFQTGASSSYSSKVTATANTEAAVPVLCQ